jgi:FixJ family two-component response regulator
MHLSSGGFDSKGGRDTIVDAHTVAVVDDDPSVRRALGRLLRSAGFTVSTFASAEAFLDRPPGAKPGCLILDLHLRGMGGAELRRTLIEAGAAIPIILMTAGDDARTRKSLQGSGVRSWLRKPVDEVTLLDAVHHALGIAHTP